MRLKPIILVIGLESDPHIQKVLDRVNLDEFEPVVLDYSKIPKHIKISYLFKPKEPTEVIFQLENRTFSSKLIHSIWYRRANNIVLDEPSLDENVKKYITKEFIAFMRSLTTLLRDKKWLIKPKAADYASLKPVNLSVAQEVGFEIPATVMGNNPEQVIEFGLSKKDIAVKALDRGFYYTSKDDGVGMKTQKVNIQTMLEKVEQIQYSPTIYQEYVEKDYELRVTVVGEKVFACKIDSQKAKNKQTHIDWRNYDLANTPHSKYDLPPEIKQKCLDLTNKMDLNFGCIDLIKTPQGKYVFLEINPYGQWLWIEKLSGLEISEAIVDFIST
jgi:RimK-like ATP-grasp domain